MRKAVDRPPKLTFWRLLAGVTVRAGLKVKVWWVLVRAKCAALAVRVRGADGLARPLPVLLAGGPAFFRRKAGVFQPLEQRQNANALIFNHLLDGFKVLPQQRFHLACRAVAKLEPNDFRWEALKHA